MNTMTRSLLAGLLVLGGAGAAQAVAINGSIGFAGVPVTDTGDLLNATAFTSFANVTVESEDGDYAGTVGTSVTFNPFTFDPGLAPSPVAPQWTFTIGPVTYSFDLEDVAVIAQTSSTLALEGSGIAKITGFDDTPGDWTLSANRSGLSFSFSSTASTVVPDGGSAVALLGLGLGLVGIARKRMA